jgi:hypothetical protein
MKLSDCCWKPSGSEKWVVEDIGKVGAGRGEERGGLEKDIIRPEDHAVKRDRSEGNEKAERGEKKK